MATYSYTVENSIKINNSGGSLETQIATFSANGKVLYDDVLPISADFSLDPFLATLDAPAHIAMRFYDPSGFKVALDGIIANVSTNSYQFLSGKFASPSGGAPSIHLLTTVPARFELIALGDPLP